MTVSSYIRRSRPSMGANTIKVETEIATVWFSYGMPCAIRTRRQDGGWDAFISSPYHARNHDDICAAHRQACEPINNVEPTLTPLYGMQMRDKLLELGL